MLLNADVREVLFTAERMPHSSTGVRRVLALVDGTPANSGGLCVEVNVPVVLGHLLAATQVRGKIQCVRVCTV